MRLDRVSSCMGQLVWKRRTENRRETCLYFPPSSDRWFFLQLYHLHHLSYMAAVYPAHSLISLLTFFFFFLNLIFNFKSMKSHFGKIKILNTWMYPRAIYVGPLFLRSAIWMFALFHQPDPCTNANLCRDSRATLIGGLLRSSKPGGGGKPQPLEKVVQRCHHDSLGDTNFRACHVTGRRFTKFASRAYFKMPMYFFSQAFPSTNSRDHNHPPTTFKIITFDRPHKTVVTTT